MGPWSRTIERMRSRARRQETSGPDDGQGVVADEAPRPLSVRQTGTEDDATPAAHVTVPHGVEVATAWSWRALVIAGAAALIYWLMGFFSELTVPLAIALLVTALATPAVDALTRVGVPRALAALVTVLGGLGVLAGMFGLVGQQVSTQFDELSQSVSVGLDQVREWLQTGPLNLSATQVTSAFQRVQDSITSGNGHLGSIAATVGTTLSHVLAGFFIVLFSSYFFLYEGQRIWAWVVRVFPRASRERLDSSGRVAWVSLTAFVRATVLVALTDAMGIALSALVLRVPLALAIGVIVFVGSFVPVVGALVSGSVAILVALVAQGPVVALIMLGAVVAVQQFESHVLQPFLMGKLVALHPLAIIFAIAGGIIAGGIFGALVAVPTVACANAVVQHLSGTSENPARAGP